MKLAEYIKDIKCQVIPSTPKGVIETIATQMIRAFDASERLTREGLVVRDLKGAVIAHPAIKIEHEAQKVFCSLLDKYKIRYR